MSIEIMNKVWNTPCQTHSQKLVMIALADNSNDQRICWPSINYLARRCDLSRQSVMDQINELIDCNLLKVRKSDGKVNVYELFPDQSKPLTGQPIVPVNAVDKPVNQGDTNHQNHSSSTKKNESYRLVVTWQREYGLRFKTTYAPKKRDFSAAKNLIGSSGKTVEELIEVAKLAWSKSGHAFWNCEKNTRELHDFVNNFNKINCELGTESKSVTKHKPAGPSQFT